MSRRPRILFVSEAVTLAQVVRLVVLARSLPDDEFDVHFASARFDELVFAGTSFRRWPIFSLDPATVERRVRGGRRIYGLSVLRRYLGEDLRLLEAVRPDVVVGDLRLSLTAAAPRLGIPHLALINAYWSPFRAEREFPLPDHPIVRLLGERVAARGFPRALPWVFSHFAAPVNRLREESGLPPIGSLQAVLTHGDLTLFPDSPVLAPSTDAAPATHHYLGPVLWAPALPRPGWWDRLDDRRPMVYVTLGSSGRAELLPAVLEAIESVGAQALVATAGRGGDGGAVPTTDVRRGRFVADFLPGDLAAARADLVISNGGSTTSYQALAAGKPVMGVASNLDQYLAMQAITAAGAGVLVRAGSATAAGMARTLESALGAPSLRRAAEGLSPHLTGEGAAPGFRRALGAVLRVPAD